jgi:Family of unknown function (DUF5675)
MNVVLQRLISNEKVTLGELTIEDKVFKTLELPWRDNKTNISCVPAGSYLATYIFSNAFKKNLFILHNVPGRDAVEIHIGNDVEDTHGCILIGMECIVEECCITKSRIAFDSFMSIAPKEGFTLTIIDVKKDTQNEPTTITQV